MGVLFKTGLVTMIPVEFRLNFYSLHMSKFLPTRTAFSVSADFYTHVSRTRAALNPRQPLWMRFTNDHAKFCKRFPLLSEANESDPCCDVTEKQRYKTCVEFQIFFFFDGYDICTRWWWWWWCMVYYRIVNCQ